MATKQSERESGERESGERESGGGGGILGLRQATSGSSARARVNPGVQGAEPLEAAAIFTFERHILGSQDSTLPHIAQHVFHLIYTDLRDDKIWIKIG